MRCRRTPRPVPQAEHRAGLGVIDIGRRDRDFLDQSRVGVGAHMSLEPMDRRPSLVLDPMRLAILFALRS